ncbi:MAG: AIM24 family protein [Candidatus Thiodiazotropha sp.]
MRAHEIEYQSIGHDMQLVEIVLDPGETVIAEAGSMTYMEEPMPLDLNQLGGRVICQKDAFLCAALGTTLGIAFNQKLGSGLFGGEGFILQKLEGDGLAFIQAGGTVIEKSLINETLRIDTGCLVGFTNGVEYDISMSGGLKSMVFGGEGAFLATLKGTGKVWIQSLPFSRMADRILQHAPKGGGTQLGED